MTKLAVPLFDVRLSDDDIAAVERTLRTGWLTMGPRTAEFERAFADSLGVRHGVATSSCTSALHLACLAAGVGPGDEVIVPAVTFVATAAAARYCGGRPVIADVLGTSDLGLDPSDVRRRFTPRTKAVCAVHYGGYACAIDALRDMCDERGVALIEDAAHSPSATPVGGGPKLGTHGLAGAFSFFSNKVLSCGEGGLLATDDDGVAEYARSRRSHAMTSGTWDRHRGHALGYDVIDLGFNYRIDEPRAALLLSRLQTLEQDIDARRRLTRRYRELLAGLDGVTVPYEGHAVDASSCYIMPVVLGASIDRDRVRRSMLERHGVQTSVLYPAIHEFSAYAAASTGALPQAEAVARRQLTLPLYPHMADEQQDMVVRALGEALTP